MNARDEFDAGGAPTSVMDADACRLFVWNWLPARYAHCDWWLSCGDFPRPEADSRAERALSVWLLRQHQLEQRWQRELPGFRWLLGEAGTLARYAREVGLAAIAGALTRLLRREDVLAARRALGEEHFSRAFQLARSFPQLAALQPLPAPPPSLEALRCHGIAWLLRRVAEADPLSLPRFRLRFSPALPDAPALPGDAAAELDELLVELDESAGGGEAPIDPLFNWTLPRPPAA